VQPPLERKHLMSQPFNIGFLLYPHLPQLDLAGPAQVLSNMPGAQLHLAWKKIEPVPTDAGFSLMPTCTLVSCPALDMLCIPGGPGQQQLMQDAAVLQWITAQGKQAKWVTSVCSGSLLLGAAGLLKGYRAASHWNYREYLHLFGAIADPARVVQDRNRITGGGVTAGIDFALSVVAVLHGEAEAKEIQLLLEYTPEPPFKNGRPEESDPLAVSRVKARLTRAVEILAEKSE
jgi:cyclohexyl-isocyanide hydratase